MIDTPFIRMDGQASPVGPMTADPTGPVSLIDRYLEFLRAKIKMAPVKGFKIDPSEVNPLLLPHQAAIVMWAAEGGCRAIFAAFGLGKTMMQLETLRLWLTKLPKGARALIVAPLGVRQEFRHDAEMLGITLTFVRHSSEVTDGGIYVTNYDALRTGNVDASLFDAISLDEGDVLRSFGSETFGELVFGPAAEVPLRLVATATPSPNEYLELIAYAHFLGVMDMGEAKTRFFKRDSTKADHLTLHPHKEREFWLWVASWAIFLEKPSDLGAEYSDEGYVLPDLRVIPHKIPVDHIDATGNAGIQKNGQARLFKDAGLGVSEAAKEKRDTLDLRIAKMSEIIDASPEDHFVIWHDLEKEREAIEAALPDVVSVYGSQKIEEREKRIVAFSEGKTRLFAAKPVIAGSGCNFQRHCHKAIFVGVGFKFKDFIQAIHRIQRFMQKFAVEIHIIFAESEQSIWDALQAKWTRDKVLRIAMQRIVREFGLSRPGIDPLARTIGCERKEVSGVFHRLINNDTVIECDNRASIADNSIGFICTSIPFSTQYEYTPSLNDFGHTDTAEHFWQQMDFLTPNLWRALKPGHVMVIHVKDRVMPGGMTKLGFPTVAPFHAEAIAHYTKHGFHFTGMCTIATDVVRENNQTYRLGWTEQCKDATPKGFGMSEFLLSFRKAPTNANNGYADEPVTKSKDDYSRGRWQLDADGRWRSSGDRLLSSDEFTSQIASPVQVSDFNSLNMKGIYRLWREACRTEVYDFDKHVEIAEALDARGILPRDFALLPAHAHGRDDLWTDIMRARTLNSRQAARNQEMHLCPFQLDIVERCIERFTDEGDVVLDPFGGLFSVAYCATKMRRKTISIELNPGYFSDGRAYVEAVNAQLSMPTLFDLEGINRSEAEEDIDLPCEVAA